MAFSGWRAAALTSIVAAAACRSTNSVDQTIPEEPASYEAPSDLPPSNSNFGSAQSESAPTTRTHVVKKGDTLFGLARQYYNNDASKWKRIYEANSGAIRNKDELRVGQELVIPD